MTTKTVNPINSAVLTILKKSAEDLMELNQAELKAYVEILSESKLPKATRHLDLVNGILKAKLKDSKEETPETVENSVKPKTRRKRTSTGAGTSKSTAKDIKETPKKKNAPVKPQEEEPDEVEATIEDLFPTDLEGMKRLELDDIKELRGHLEENPFKVYSYIYEDEKTPTVFLVIFADDKGSDLVMLDATNKQGSTLRLKAKSFNTKEYYTKFGKEKFMCAFYIKEA